MLFLACLFLGCASEASDSSARLDAYVLTGGVPGFAAAGGAVVKGKDRWDLERQVRLVAGSLVVLGLAGGRFVSPKIRTLAGVIGTGLTFSAATNTCAMGMMLGKLPYNRGASCDLDTIEGQLRETGGRA